jgi:hypothetical protein
MAKKATNGNGDDEVGQQGEVGEQTQGQDPNVQSQGHRPLSDLVGAEDHPVLAQIQAAGWSPGSFFDRLQKLFGTVKSDLQHQLKHNGPVTSDIMSQLTHLEEHIAGKVTPAQADEHDGVAPARATLENAT